MAQFLRPISDNSIMAWRGYADTTTDLFSYIDDISQPTELSFDYIYCDRQAIEQTYNFDLSFASTPSSGTRTLKITAYTVSAIGTRYIKWNLRQGSTVVQTGQLTPTNTLTTYTFEITASITDYSDLNIDLIYFHQNRRPIEVHWVELEIPDASSSATNFIQIGGVWRDINDIQVQQGGSWRNVSKIYKKISGVWEESQ